MQSLKSIESDVRVVQGGVALIVRVFPMRWIAVHGRKVFSMPFGCVSKRWEEFSFSPARFPRILEREQLRPRILGADALHARWQARSVPVPEEGDPAPHPVRALRSLQLAEEQVGRVEGGEVTRGVSSKSILYF